MSIQYCEKCNRKIDTELDANHFTEVHPLEDIKVETIDWSKEARTPADKEFLRQKEQQSRKFCRHLKGLKPYYGEIYDDKLDEAITVEKKFCRLCGVEVTSEMEKQINKTLENFKKKAR